MNTQEQKELLLKDLCARLPYDVKVQSYNYEKDIETIETLREIDSDGCMSTIECDTLKYIHKPYLFPLSSITEKQKRELNKLSEKECEIIEDVVNNPTPSNVGFPIVTHYMVDWCNKNHFDYRGLISMGLAIDATGLNIY